MKVLVTGGAGFIGSAFVRLLLGETSHRVVNLDKLTYAGNLENLRSVESSDRYRIVEGDVCDWHLVESLLAREKPDAIVHFAAESHVDRSILSELMCSARSLSSKRPGAPESAASSMFPPMKSTAVSNRRSKPPKNTR